MTKGEQAGGVKVEIKWLEVWLSCGHGTKEYAYGIKERF
jgi:hypothetical protein